MSLLTTNLHSIHWSNIWIMYQSFGAVLHKILVTLYPINVMKYNSGNRSTFLSLKENVLWRISTHKMTVICPRESIVYTKSHLCLVGWIEMWVDIGEDEGEFGSNEEMRKKEGWMESISSGRMQFLPLL